MAPPRIIRVYEDSMTKVILPIHEESLQCIHEASRAESLKSFDEQHFGRHHAKKSVETLDEDIEKMFKNFMMANQYQSSKLCEALHTKCEDQMDQLQVLRLLSMAKFNATKVLEKSALGHLKPYMLFVFNILDDGKVEVIVYKGIQSQAI
ncbi:putative guanylate-binding protein/Atlastin [Helianthus annuus]|nr:putative guanylate-binding protein/Atlastin [Helianthus annuus]